MSTNRRRCERMQRKDRGGIVDKTKNSPMFLTLSLDKSRKLLHLGEFGFCSSARIVMK